MIICWFLALKVYSNPKELRIAFIARGWIGSAWFITSWFFNCFYRSRNSLSTLTHLISLASQCPLVFFSHWMALESVRSLASSVLMVLPICWSSFLCSACLAVSRSISSMISGREDFCTSNRRWSSLACASRVWLSSKSFAFWALSANLFLALVTWTSWYSMKATGVRVSRMSSEIWALICSKKFLNGTASCTSMLISWLNSWRISWIFSLTSSTKGVGDRMADGASSPSISQLRSWTYYYPACFVPAQQEC